MLAQVPSILRMTSYPTVCRFAVLAWAIQAWVTPELVGQSSSRYRPPQDPTPGNAFSGQQTFGQASASASSNGGQSFAQSNVQFGQGGHRSPGQSYGDGISPGFATQLLGNLPAGMMPMNLSTTAHGENGETIERTHSVVNGQPYRKTIVKKDKAVLSIVENDEEGIQVSVQEGKKKKDEVKTYFAKSRDELKQAEPEIYRWVEKYANDNSSQLQPGISNLPMNPMPSPQSAIEALQKEMLKNGMFNNNFGNLNGFTDGGNMGGGIMGGATAGGSSSGSSFSGGSSSGGGSSGRSSSSASSAGGNSSSTNFPGRRRN